MKNYGWPKPKPGPERPILLDAPFPRPSPRRVQRSLLDEPSRGAFREASRRAALQDRLGFGADQLEKKLATLLAGFDVAVALATHTNAGDQLAARQLRSILGRLAPFDTRLLTREHERYGAELPRLGPCDFPSFGGMATLFVAVAVLATDREDGRALLRGVRALYRSVAWGESLFAAALVSKSDNGLAFKDRVVRFMRMMPGLEEARQLDGPSLKGAVLSSDFCPPMPPPIDPCAFVKLKCLSGLDSVVRVIITRKRALFYPMLDPGIVFPGNITSIDPRRACAGAVVTVKGSGFGAAKPNHIELLIPGEIPDYGVACRAVTTQSWIDTAITFMVPSWARGGTIGFIDMNGLAAWESFATWVGAILEESRVRETLIAGTCGAHVLQLAQVEPVPIVGCPADTGTNVFLGTIPEITFPASPDGHLVVAPGEATLSWMATNTDHLSIRQPIMASGPALSLDLGPGPTITGSFTLDFEDFAERDCIYQFRAVNPCAPISRTLFVHVRQPAEVSIAGVEHMQVVQQFIVGRPHTQNPIPLIAGKSTVLRVFIDPGISGAALRHITGEATVTPLSGQANGNLAPGYPFAPHSYQPLQPLAAPPVDDIAHDNQRHSLNFQIDPDACRGDVRIDYRIFSTDPYAVWTPVTYREEISFERGRQLKLYVFMVRDRNGRMPSPEEVEDSLSKIQSILPIDPERLIIVGMETLYTNLNLKDDDQFFACEFWSTDLFDELEAAAEDHQGEADIYLAIVADASRNETDGIGWPGGADAFGGSGERLAYFVANVGGNDFTCAHEIGHALNLRHTLGMTRILGVDARYPIAFKPRDTEQLMNESATTRWVNPGEYLHLIGGLTGTEIMTICVEAEMPFELSTFYVGL